MRDKIPLLGSSRPREQHPRDTRRGLPDRRNAPDDAAGARYWVTDLESLYPAKVGLSAVRRGRSLRHRSLLVRARRLPGVVVHSSGTVSGRVRAGVLQAAAAERRIHRFGAARRGSVATRLRDRGECLRRARQNGRRCPDPRVFSRRLTPPRAETRPPSVEAHRLASVSRADAAARSGTTAGTGAGRRRSSPLVWLLALLLSECQRRPCLVSDVEANDLAARLDPRRSR